MAKSIKVNAFSKTLLNVVNILIPLLAGPYLARILNVKLYAEYNSANSIIMWFIPFATLGIYNFGIRSISSVRNNQKKVNELFSEFFIIGFLSTVLVIIVYIGFVLAFISVSDRLLYIILIIQLISQMFYVEWMNEAYEMYGFIFWKTAIIKILHLVSVFLFIHNKNDIEIYACIVSITMFINYVASFIYVKQRVHFTKVKLSNLIKLLKPLLIMLLLVNANMLYTYLDRLFISVFGNNVIEISYYQFSLSIIMLITQVINSITVVTIPRLSNYISNGNYNESNLLFKKTIRIFLMLGIPMCLGISAVSKDIIFIYGGEKYLAASISLFLFGIRTLIWLIDRILASQVLFVYGKENKISKIYLCYGIVNLILNSILVVFNILSASTVIITTIISELLMVICEYREVKQIKSFKCKLICKENVVYFCSALIMFIYIVLFKSIIGMNTTLSIDYLIKLAFIIISGSLLYFVIIWVMKDEYLVGIAHKIKIIILQKNKSK